MRTRPLTIARGAAATAALALTVGLPVVSAGDDRQAAREPKRGKVRVEIVLTAHDAYWRPGARRGSGRLVLDRISPRMVVMMTAPRQRVAVVPASLLAMSWERLFRRTRGRTNAVLSYDVRGEPRLSPLEVDLGRRYASGKRMSFAVRRLRHTAHSSPHFGPKPRRFEPVTLVVDPIITDAIRAIWDALIELLFGEEVAAPPNPTWRTADGRLEFRNGAPAGADPIYAGPLEARIDTDLAWRSTEANILSGAGPWVGSDSSGRATSADPLREPGGNILFEGKFYNGLALFNHTFGTLTFEQPPSNVIPPSARIRDLAVFEVDADAVTFELADIGGLNMRATSIGTFNLAHTAVQGADLTGAKLGSETGARGKVENAVFIDVTANRSVRLDDGSPDRATEMIEGADAPIVIRNTDVKWVLFQNADFAEASLESATFAGCSFLNVDLTDALIRGVDPALNGNRFEQTFDNSIMENVKLDGAQLRNVSFAGVDFAAGTVSLDGADLANVDFTGAKGLQHINWNSITVSGRVWGLGDFGGLVNTFDPNLLRSVTFDGGERGRIVPEVRQFGDTLYDVEPAHDWLIDPDTGVRLLVDEEAGELIPMDPFTEQPMIDPQTKDPLRYEGGRLFNLETDVEFRVDFETGRLEL
jgi:uncharacterized protein YjbI with pentapeptide repeats